MSSPFTSKLGTNYCPSDEENIEIRSLLVEPTRRLQCLDDEIADLQKAVEKLRDERDKLGAYVDAHMALISPVRRLPLDIIQKIFIACLPAHRNCVMSAVEAPVLLGRICSSWRTISLSTPHLWSRLHVVEPTPPYFAVLTLIDKKVAQRLEITKMWLGRSGQCPLSISVKAIASKTGFAAQIIQALLPFKSRWEHIAFTAESSVFGALSHLTEVDVPMLKSIHMTEIDDHTSLRWDSLQFLRSSNILSAYISGGNFTPLELPLRDLSIEIRWYRDGIPLTRDMTLQVFSRCPQLRTCRLQIDSEVENHSSLAELILELPFLHTLAVECFGKPSTTLLPLFNRLSLPQLRSLTLCGTGRDDPTLYGPSSYGPFFAAAPRIESLEFTTKLFSETSLTDFLRGIPHTIREIKINAVSAYSEGPSNILDDEIIELLIPSSEFPTTTHCCPGLQVLEINTACYFSEDTLLRFIESRTLKCLIVHFAREMERDVRPLVQCGLDLDLTYLPPSGILSPWYGLADAPS
ncbi:hypothetical protein DFH09DRAFT_1219374 [Mycena vulgaris]|nr:hypothetical protein DFH09DRAFT_1219374 [Mycena vulgaris]